MSRTLLALAAGAALGVGTTLLLLRGAPHVPSATLPPPLLSPPSAGATPPASARIDGDFYRLLAGAGLAELDTMLSRAAAAPPSSERDFTLALLLKRYSDFDAETAVRRTLEAGVNGPALGAVYGAWARSDPNAALGGLRTLDNANDAAEAGAALVAALGNDVGAVERVAAVLIARNDAPTVVGPVAAFSAFGPTGPFAASRSALQLMAERWATIDPGRALALASDLDDDRIRIEIEVAALRAVTPTSAEVAFAHLDTLDLRMRERAVIGALGELVRADPAKLLDTVRDFSPDPRRFVEMRALNQLAERDPLAAAQYLDRLPVGNERQALVQTVARAFGRQDPTAALAWARAVDERNAVAAVIGGIGERDSQRAIDLALELAPSERMSAIQAILMRTAWQLDAEAGAIADRLFALDDQPLQAYLGAMFLPQWAARSPESAMRWLVANVETASPNLFQGVAQRFAGQNPQAAIAYATAIPAAAREAWINGLAQGYAQKDPRGALEWFGQFRGELWYGRTAMSLAMTLAQHDGAAAAQLIDETDPAGTGPQSQQTLQVVANNWANRDPAAAVQWAMARPAERQRAQAVEAVVGVWAARDPTAARDWVLQLPSTDIRDRSLARLLTATTYRSSMTLDAVVLSAFGSDAARQHAVLRTVQSMAQVDALRARAIADTHLTDTALRAQAEAALNGERRGGAFSQQVIEGARIEAMNLAR